MIQLTQRGLQSSDADVKKARAEFAETGCAILPGFLSAAILEPVLEKLNTARLDTKNEVSEHGIFGTTLFAADDDPARIATNFVLNNTDLFRLVESITGCLRLENFVGRLHRTVSTEPGQHIGWHNDLVDFREMGLNINLSTEPYTGGLLQLRDASFRIRAEVGQLPAGDAFLFTIAEGWAHRLTPVTSGTRTVSVGWFRTAPERRVFARNWLGYSSTDHLREVVK